MDNVLQNHPRSSRNTPREFLVPSLKARKAFVDPTSNAKQWEGVKTISALVVILALLAFSCWLNIYWCFGWC